MMQKRATKKAWVPEIYYEEGTEGLSGQIPFITVPKEEEMPKMLFIFESRETGEFEPGSRGEELPVTEITLHQYADMAILKERLAVEDYDRVRAVLDLKPMREATESGRQITQNVREKFTN